MHSVTSRAYQSVHIAAGPVIVIYRFQRCWGVERSSVSWTAALNDTDPEVKPNAKDMSLKAKTKDMPYCPRGHGLEVSNTA